MKIYSSAKKFIKRYSLKKDYTYDDLKLIAGKQGCVVYEWSNDLAKDEAYLRRANCWDIAQTTNGFSFWVSDTKILFIKRSLIDRTRKENTFASRKHTRILWAYHSR